MRNRKRHKTIDDVSVSQLLDDFLRVDVIDSGRPPKEIDDEEYIRLMLKKDAQKKLERTRRKNQAEALRRTSIPKSDAIDDDIRKHFFPDVDDRPIEKRRAPVEKKRPPKEEPVTPDNGIVAEILDSIVVKDVSELAAQMRQAVDFVQEEMGTSESERRLAAALDDYSRRKKAECEREDCSKYNDNVLLLKRCQNCFFSVGEKTVNGSLWCLCTNPDRSPDVEIEDSWVKSSLNLPCWKAPED